MLVEICSSHVDCAGRHYFDSMKVTGPSIDGRLGVEPQHWHVIPDELLDPGVNLGTPCDVRFTSALLYQCVHGGIMVAGVEAQWRHHFAIVDLTDEIVWIAG